jgi:hypothetical protein
MRIFSRIKKLHVVSGAVGWPVFALAFGDIAAWPEPPPVPVGRRLQLFVDSALVERSDGVCLRLQAPRPAEIALKFDAPWEGSRNHYPTVFKDGDRYRMYYRSWHRPHLTADQGRPKAGTWLDQPTFICYAESRDEISWARPDLGLFEFEGSRHNNIVWTDEYHVSSDASELLFPARNDKPGVPRDLRYLAPGARLHEQGKNVVRLYLFASADGIHWRQLLSKPIFDKATSTCSRCRNRRGQPGGG